MWKHFLDLKLVVFFPPRNVCIWFILLKRLPYFIQYLYSTTHCATSTHTWSFYCNIVKSYVHVNLNIFLDNDFYTGVTADPRFYGNPCEQDGPERCPGGTWGLGGLDVGSRFVYHCLRPSEDWSLISTVLFWPWSAPYAQTQGTTFIQGCFQVRILIYVSKRVAYSVKSPILSVCKMP